VGRRFYSYRSIFRRLSFRWSSSHEILANLVYRRSITANPPRV
jgi:hypothetical protein